MKDLRRDLQPLSRSLERIPGHQGGRQVMLIGTDEKVDTPSVAASLAIIMSGRSQKSAWLIDLDLVHNQQYRGFEGRTFSKLGKPGRALDASLNVRPFYQVHPQVRSQDGKVQRPPKLLAAHQVGTTQLYVTSFRAKGLKPGQKLNLTPAPDYWRQLRHVTDWAIVDAPPIEKSRAGLAVCRHMDGVVLVMQLDKTSVDEIHALRDEIEAHGGHCLGVVATGVKADARFADRFAI